MIGKQHILPNAGEFNGDEYHGIDSVKKHPQFQTNPRTSKKKRKETRQIQDTLEVPCPALTKIPPLSPPPTTSQHPMAPGADKIGELVDWLNGKNHASMKNVDKSEDIVAVYTYDDTTSICRFHMVSPNLAFLM